MNDTSFTGLDIGSTHVAAAVATLQGSDPTDYVITGLGMCACAGLQKGAVVDAEAVIRAIEQAVDQAGRQAGCDVDSVYVGVTGAHISSLTSTGSVTLANGPRDVQSRDIDQVIEASRIIVLPPDRQIIHVIPLIFSIDGRQCPAGPLSERGTRLQVQTHVVHGASAMLKSVEKCVTGAGLDINETVLETIAAGEAVLTGEEKESGVCLLDIGGSTTNLAVFASGVLYHQAMLPVGSNHVTNDIIYGLTVSRDEAERLKIQNGCAMVDMVPQDEVVPVHQVGRDSIRKLRRRALVQIIEPRMQELFQFAAEELKLADCLDRINDGVVLTGGGSLMNGCMEMANDILEMPIRLGYAKCDHAASSDLKQPEYVNAIGLARYGAQHHATTSQQSVATKRDPVRSVWSQFVQSIKRSVPPH